MSNKCLANKEKMKLTYCDLSLFAKKWAKGFMCTMLSNTAACK